MNQEPDETQTMLIPMVS